MPPKQQKSDQTLFANGQSLKFSQYSAARRALRRERAPDVNRVGAVESSAACGGATSTYTFPSADHRSTRRISPDHLLRLHLPRRSQHSARSFPSLSSMAAYPCVAAQNVKDLPLPSACQPAFAQPSGSSADAMVRLYFVPLHSRTFLLSSTRSGYVFPSTLHE